MPATRLPLGRPPDENDCSSDNTHVPANRSCGTPRPAFSKEFPVSCIPKNSFPPVAAIHHVVNRPFILRSELSCHAHKTTCRLILVNTKNRPVYKRMRTKLPA